jgi:hypothetical protein
MWYARQKLNIPFNIRSWLIYIFIGGLVCGLLYVSKDWPVSHWLIIIVTGIMALIVLWFTKLVDLKTWKGPFRQ